MGTAHPSSAVSLRWRWLRPATLVGGGFVAVVLWAFLTQPGGIIDGDPSYGVMLALTGAAGVVLLVAEPGKRTRDSRHRPVAAVLAVVLGLVWIGVVAWFRPYSATEPALQALVDSQSVAVEQDLNQVLIRPGRGTPTTGVFFQPGALVDARAYAAHLRPLAEAGYLVVIDKQPLGVAFFAINDFDRVKSQHPYIEKWVVGGHSLGGVVAAMEAVRGDQQDQPAPVVGLVLWASYPASNIRDDFTGAVLSISGTQDGLSTPAKIDASKADLPANTQYLPLAGVCHGQFGSYGKQRGDGNPTISDQEARTEISEATLDFVRQFD